MAHHTRLVPRDVALRLTLVMGVVVGLATATTGWLLGMRPELALLLAGLGFVVAVAMIGATLLLLEWWVKPSPPPAGFPRLRFDAGGPPVLFNVPPASEAAERYVVLNDVTATNEAGRPVSLDLRLRAYYTDDEYLVWRASGQTLPEWEAERPGRGVAQTPLLELPIELDANGHARADGYVAFRMEDHPEATDVLREHRDRLRFVLEATDRESKAVRTTDLDQAL